MHVLDDTSYRKGRFSVRRQESIEVSANNMVATSTLSSELLGPLLHCLELIPHSFTGMPLATLAALVPCGQSCPGQHYRTHAQTTEYHPLPAPSIHFSLFGRKLHSQSSQLADVRRPSDAFRPVSIHLENRQCLSRTTHPQRVKVSAACQDCIRCAVAFT